MTKDNLKTVRLTDEEKAALLWAVECNMPTPLAANTVIFDATDTRRLTIIRRAVAAGFYSDAMPADAVIRGLRNMARARGLSL